jgi:hypothetical protein
LVSNISKIEENISLIDYLDSKEFQIQYYVVSENLINHKFKIDFEKFCFKKNVFFKNYIFLWKIK